MLLRVVDRYAYTGCESTAYSYLFYLRDEQILIDIRKPCRSRTCPARYSWSLSSGGIQMYERTNLLVATETRPIRNMCVPNPFQNYAKSESLWNHGSDEVAILAATAISPTFTGRRTVSIMCNIPLHHLPLPFRNLVQDLLTCISDARRKPLDRLQVRPAFILEVPPMPSTVR